MMSKLLRQLTYFALFICLGSISVLAETAEQKPVRLYFELESNDSYSIYADNDRIVPSYISLEFTSLINLKANVPLPFETTLPAGAQRVQLMTLTPGSGKTTHFAYTWLNIKGDPLTVHPDPAFPYIFPYEHGQKYKVVQGFNGKFTHFDQNQYALDFNLPEGSPVFAARDGLVSDVKEDSNSGGPGVEFNDLANYVMIYHSDGTFGNYVHLKLHGAVVNVGDQVKAGELIGYSGNTGRSSGPHLHFDVRVPTKKGITQSIPIQLLNYDGKIVTPQEGLYYYSIHPGRASFPVQLGRLLRLEDFKSYVAAPDQADKVDIRNEQIDDTLVIFVSNGKAYAIQADVKLELHNMVSLSGNPLKIRIPAKTELFLCLLNPVNPSESYSYNASMNYSAAH